MRLFEFRRILPACVSLGVALAGTAGIANGAIRNPTSVAAPLARIPGPHLFVSEQYDVAGGVWRAVSFPIVDGLVQPGLDFVYSVGSAVLTTRPDGLVLSAPYAAGPMDTLSPRNGKVVASLDFQPCPRQCLYPNPTEAHVDAAGRVYVAFFYLNYQYRSALSIYRPGASGKDAPYAIVPLPNASQGIATLDDAVYVSTGAHGTIDVFAPARRPRLVREITGLQGPAGLGFDRRGELYVCNAGTGTVLALPPNESGPVRPDRVISVKGQPLCRMQSSIFAGGNELAVAGDRLFVAADDARRIFDLDATLNGPQTPLASISLPHPRQPWQAIDLAVGAR
jgi:hypothetical protein